MTQWLESHAYIAAWLALPVAILVALYQTKGLSFENVDWQRLIVNVLLIVSLAVVLNPDTADKVRITANSILFMTLAATLVGVARKR